MACCIPAPPSEHLAGGKEECWEGIDVYVNQPTGDTPSSAVLLAADVFGWATPLLRKLADKIAAAGFLVVVPDYFHGDPFTPKAGTIQSWLPSHLPEGKPVEETKKVLSIIRSKGISSVGLGGFCWGAKVGVVFAQGSEVSSVVMCHPSFVTEDDIKAVTQPIAILAAETDHITPVEKVIAFREILSSKNQESLVKIYPGTSHGWTVRYEVKDEAEVKRAEEAHADMINWFKKILAVPKL